MLVECPDVYVFGFLEKKFVLGILLRLFTRGLKVTSVCTLKDEPPIAVCLGHDSSGTACFYSTFEKLDTTTGRSIDTRKIDGSMWYSTLSSKLCDGL